MLKKPCYYSYMNKAYMHKEIKLLVVPFLQRKKLIQRRKMLSMKKTKPSQGPASSPTTSPARLWGAAFVKKPRADVVDYCAGFDAKTFPALDAFLLPYGTEIATPLSFS